MWNFENTNHANRTLFSEFSYKEDIQWYEIYQFKRYYYIIKTEELGNQNYKSIVSFFKNNGEKFFDMEIRVFKHKEYYNSIQAVERKIIKTLKKITRNDSYWEWFFLAKKMELKEAEDLWTIEDIYFYISDKENKNKIKEVVKKWVYQVNYFYEMVDFKNETLYTFLFKEINSLENSFFFSSQEVKDIKSLWKIILDEDTYYSNKNKLTDEYYTISNDKNKISSIIYYKLLQILFSFFEKELEKKEVKDYEIFLWYFDKYVYKKKYSRIWLLFFKLLISVDWKVDEKLTKELLDSYEKSWGILKEKNWEKDLLCFIDNEFSPIFSFDRKFLENEFYDLIDLWNNYFYFREYFDIGNWEQNHIVCKYSFKEEKFIIIEEMTTIVASRTNDTVDSFIKFQSKNWFCYINKKAELKVFIKWIGEYIVNIRETFWIKDFKISDAYRLETTDDWKNIFIKYHCSLSLYLILKNWKFIKKIFKDIWEHKISPNNFQEYTSLSELKNNYWFNCDWFKPFISYSRKNFYVSIGQLLNIDREFNINWKRMFDNIIYMPIQTSIAIEKKQFNWYRVINWLKWYSFLKKHTFPASKEKYDSKKENIFSKWVFTSESLNLNTDVSYIKFCTSQNHSIEEESTKIIWKKMSWLSIGKIWFYE